MTKKIRRNLSAFRSVFFREKYRFDQGNAFLVFLNFALLVVSLVHQGNGNSQMIKWYIILGFAGTWLLGYFLDRVVRVQDAQEKIALNRSPIWKENFERHDMQHEKLSSIYNKLDEIEKLLKES